MITGLILPPPPPPKEEDNPPPDEDDDPPNPLEPPELLGRGRDELELDDLLRFGADARLRPPSLVLRRRRVVDTLLFLLIISRPL